VREHHLFHRQLVIAGRDDPTQQLRFFTGSQIGIEAARPVHRFRAIESIAAERVFLRRGCGGRGPLRCVFEDLPPLPIDHAGSRVLLYQIKRAVQPAALDAAIAIDEHHILC
jgi:hypothetical protein